MKRTRTYRKWVGRITLGLAVAAIAAPAAQGYYFDEVGTAGNVPSAGPAGPTLQQFRFAQSQSPTAAQAYADAWEALQRFLTPTAAQAYGDAFEAIQRLVPDAPPAQVPVSTPSDAPVGPTLTHPFSFTPSNEPVGPTVVIPDPTRGLPSLDDLQQFRFQPNAPEAPVAVPTSGPGIDWTDASIGAGIAIAAMLLAMAGALGLRRNRRLAHS